MVNRPKNNLDGYFVQCSKVNQSGELHFISCGDLGQISNQDKGWFIKNGLFSILKINYNTVVPKESRMRYSY